MKVAIIMGSASDWGVVCFLILSLSASKKVCKERRF